MRDEDPQSHIYIPYVVELSILTPRWEVRRCQKQLIFAFLREGIELSLARYILCLFIYLPDRYDED